MSTEVELTAGRLRRASNLDDSSFLALYTKLMRRDSLTEAELVDTLRFAILFLRSSDSITNRLGYRIILQYGSATRDYRPLHDVAQSRDLAPVVVATETIDPSLRNDSSLEGVFAAAHNMNFVTEETNGATITRTRGQMELRSFNTRESNAVVVAPTSYGKSEMMIENVAMSLDARTCILVPSRALISQTRAMVIADDRVRNARVRVITHPDAYSHETTFIAVLTQERLQRLLIQNPALVFDKVLVDEAHNLLDGEVRAIELSQVIIIAKHRNPALAVTYYTPFVANPDNLRVLHEPYGTTKAKVVNEHVKAERIIIAQPGTRAILYDQYLNRTIELKTRVPHDEIKAMDKLSGHRTLLYVNRPKNAQDLALALAARHGEQPLSPEARRAVDAISDLIDPEYALVTVIKAGLLYHHGQLPDVLRQYIEALFRTDSSASKRQLVTTSTLLEGINSPADTLILLSHKRGARNLSLSAFRNLMGRVARFREIFSAQTPNLDLLQPRIALLPCSYSSSSWNPQGFLETVADLAKTVKDDVLNPLLEAASESPDRQAALQQLENIEPGTSGLLNPKLATTEIGVLCFQNGVHDFDILDYEGVLQARIDTMRNDGVLISTPTDLVDCISNVFFLQVALTDAKALERVRDEPGARAFYSMFIDWRTRNEPLKQVVGHFVAYWQQLGDDYVYVGRRWGEEIYGEDRHVRLYVHMRTKTRSEMINLAVVKIKEEQDFVDYELFKYVETLHGLGMLSGTFYYQVKYGTDDEYIICLLRNGFSPDLARVVATQYTDHIDVDIARNSVEVEVTLPVAMESGGENAILVYEAQTLVT